MAVEKASKININGQEYEIKDAQAREALDNKVDLSVYEETIQENLTPTPIDIADVFSLPTGAEFMDGFGYCYKMGKLLFVSCTIASSNIIAQGEGRQTETGIAIKSEYLRKMESSLMWPAQAIIEKVDSTDTCGALIIMDIEEEPNRSVTMGFPDWASGAEVTCIMFTGVIPLTKE